VEVVMNTDTIACVDGVKNGVIQVTMTFRAAWSPLTGKHVILKAGRDVILGRVRGTSLWRHSPEAEIEQGEIEELVRVGEDWKFGAATCGNPRSGTEVRLATRQDMARFEEATGRRFDDSEDVPFF
jgi:hypothetical protein